jgi:hypothetical protein
MTKTTAGPITIGPKRHHYLPEFYLKGFCRDEGLWIYDRPRDSFRKQTPANTGVKKLYYAFEDQAGARRTEIETFLSRVESDAKICIDRVRARDGLSSEMRQKLALFLALLHTRVPEFHELIQEMYEKMTKATLRLLLRQQGAMERLLTATRKGNEPDVVTPEQMKEFIERDEYRVRLGREGSLRPMLELSFGLANALSVMNWAVCEAPADTSFVTSDNPVVPFWPKREGFYPTPFLSPEVTKLVPLAYDTLLVMAGEGGFQVRQKTDSASVRAYNVLVAGACGDYVIGRDEALIRSIVSKARVRTRPPRERIRMA